MEAKRRGRELANSYQFWFRQKYNLSPADPRFLVLTPEDIEAEYWADHYTKNNTSEEFDDDDFDVEAYASEADEDWETVIDHSLKS